MHLLLTVSGILFQIVLIAALADFIAGVVHWAEDAYFTEDTPVIAEATAFSSGIVIAQVNEVLDTLPRIDIPADWVGFVVQSPQPHFIEPRSWARPPWTSR